jgi:sugar phosphate isomerase/epimerase
VQALKAYADDHQLTYTVHLPKDIGADPHSLLLAERVITATRPLQPAAVILHFDGRPLLSAPDATSVARWQGEARAHLAHIVAMVGDPALVCVENLERWNPDLFDEIVEEAGVSRCIDIGHLWLDGRDPLPYLQRHLPHTRVIHLHGIGNTDHQSLAHMPVAVLQPVCDLLQARNYTGIVTLEVFSEDDFTTSLPVLQAATAHRNASLT